MVKSRPNHVRPYRQNRKRNNNNPPGPNGKSFWLWAPHWFVINLHLATPWNLEIGNGRKRPSFLSAFEARNVSPPRLYLGFSHLGGLGVLAFINLFFPRMWWSIVLLGVFFIGLTKSGFGSGLGLLAVPMITLAMARIPGRGAQAGIGFMLPLLISGDLIAIWQYRKLFSLAIVKRLFAGSFVGLVIGGALLWWFHHQKNEVLAGAVISIEIGVESIFLVSLYWWRQYRGVQKALMREPARSNITGAFAAVSSTLAHGAGPIIATYLLPLGLDRKLYVGTCAAYFAFLNTAKLPAYALTGQFSHASPWFALRFLPVVLAGALFGVWVNRRMSDKLFMRIVYVTTFFLGWYVLYEGIANLIKP